MKKRLILLAVILALLLAIWVIPAGAEEIVEIEYLPDDEIIEFSAGASALLNSDADTWQSDWNTYKDQLTGYAVQFYESLEATFLDDELKQKSVLTIDGYVLCWDMTHYPFESKSFKAATDAAAYDAYALWMTENQIVPSMTAAAIAFTNDYPEFFWIRHAFVPAMQTSKRTYYSNDVAVAVEYVTNPRLFFAVQHMTQTTSEIDAYQTSLDATVQAIMAQTTGMRPDEKVALFDQWLAANVHYDCAAVNAGAEVDETPWSVVGSLVTGQAVCEGYAKALQLLCHEAGIPCVTVSGWGTGNGKTEKHMWAAVKLDGLWYFCDPTWDDPVHYPNQTESTKNTSTGEYLLIGQPASHAT